MKPSPGPFPAVGNAVAQKMVDFHAHLLCDPGSQSVLFMSAGGGPLWTPRCCHTSGSKTLHNSVVPLLR